MGSETKTIPNLVDSFVLTGHLDTSRSEVFERLSDFRDVALLDAAHLRVGQLLDGPTVDFEEPTKHVVTNIPSEFRQGVANPVRREWRQARICEGLFEY